MGNLLTGAFVHKASGSGLDVDEEIFSKLTDLSQQGQLSVSRGNIFSKVN